MRKGQQHPSDEQLLRFADRELSGRRSAEVGKHLALCELCQERMKELQGTLAAFVSLHEDGMRGRPALRSESRARLKGRLSQAAQYRRPRAALSTNLVLRHFASACIAVVLVAGAAWALRESARELSRARSSDQLASALPRRRLTPGATRSVRLDDLCGNQELHGPQTVDASVERQVFTEYGLSSSSRGAYELDYLITPELGGSAEIQNLWPEPYSSTSWNAHVKDELENHLHALVCQGKLPLATAQEEIATDWIAAYKRHFHTEIPLTNAASIAPPAERRGAPAKAVPYSPFAVAPAGIGGGSFGVSLRTKNS